MVKGCCMDVEQPWSPASLTLLAATHWFVMKRKIVLWKCKEHQLQSSLNSSRNGELWRGAWQKWTLQRVHVNVYNRADCIGNVSSLWVMIIWRNAFYDPYFLERREVLNGSQKTSVTLGVEPLPLLCFYFFLSSQATLMFFIFRHWSGTFTWRISFLSWRQNVFNLPAFHWLPSVTWYRMDSLNPSTGPDFHYEHSN